jgi:hypothetical protein
MSKMGDFLGTNLSRDAMHLARVKETGIFTTHANCGHEGSNQTVQTNPALYG